VGRHLVGLGISGGGGAPNIFLSGLFQQIINVFFKFLSSSPFDWHPCWVNLLKGGYVCLVTEMHGMPPSVLRGVFMQITSD